MGRSSGESVPRASLPTEQAAAAALTKHGVLVVAEPPDKAVTSVAFCGKPLDEEASRRLADLYRIQSIDLAGSKLSDGAVVLLQRHVASDQSRSSTARR